jgi:hypothetical protein
MERAPFDGEAAVSPSAQSSLTPMTCASPSDVLQGMPIASEAKNAAPMSPLGVAQAWVHVGSRVC